jgi:glycosyltransferase involved in cell wall biosynthesis
VNNKLRAETLNLYAKQRSRQAEDVAKGQMPWPRIIRFRKKMSMPSLLSINNYHYRRGGSDVVYLDHAALMEELGWDNAFFSMHHPSNITCKWDKYFVDEIEYGHTYSLLQKLAMAAKIVYSLEAQRKITSLVKDFRPDIAHMHCIYHHLSPSILPTLRKLGVPVVMTAHELKLLCPAHKMMNSAGICERCKGGNLSNVIIHRCIKKSVSLSALVYVESTFHRLFGLYKKNLDKVITPSRFYFEKYIEWGWPRERLVYIPNCVDSALFEPQFVSGNYFVYFGRLSPEKGVATLIKAAAAAKVPLKIAGTGPEEEYLRSLNNDLGGNAEFLGYRSGSALHDLIRHARATVLPSEWYENAPLSVLESYALGKPVIGARIGGISEMVREETGWLFESGNTESLIDVLRSVTFTPDLKVADKGREGRRVVEEKYSPARYLNEMLNLYRSIGVYIG